MSGKNTVENQSYLFPPCNDSFPLLVLFYCTEHGGFKVFKLYLFCLCKSGSSHDPAGVLTPLP